LPVTIGSFLHLLQYDEKEVVSVHNLLIPWGFAVL